MASLPEPHLLQAFRQAVRRHFEAEIARENDEADGRKDAVVPAVRKAVADARAEGLCASAWLFGSYAWGRPGERSDVDVLVDGCSDPFGLASRVGRAAGRDVHVIAWSEAPESLRRRATSEGLVL